MTDHTLQYFDTPTAHSYRLAFRTKVTVLIGALVLVTWGTVSYWTTKNFNAALVNESLMKVGHDAELAGVRLSTEIRGFVQDVRFLTGTPPFRGIIRAQISGGIDPLDQSTLQDWKNRFATIVTKFIEAKTEFFQIQFIGVAQNGRELVRVSQPWGYIEQTPEAELQEIGDETYFQDTIRQPRGTIHFSQIRLNREHGEISSPLTPTLRIAMPIFTPLGQVFGMFVVNVNMSYLFSDMHRNLKSQQMLYVANNEGDYLVHPESLKTFGFDFGESHKIQSSIPDAAEWLASTQSGGQPFIHTNFQKESVIGLAKAQFDPADPERYVIVAIHDSYHHVLAKATTTQQETLLLSIGLLFFALIGALFLSRSIVSPLKDFSRAAAAVGRGEKKIRFPVYSKDEVGQLAMSFNAMAQQIEERTTLLERKENQFREIVEAAPSGMIMVDQHGIIVLINQLMVQQFGYSQEELVGHKIEILLPERSKHNHPALRTAFFHSPQPRQMGQGRELYGRRKDGSEFPVEIGLNPLTTEDGEFVLAAVVDITERKHIQEAFIQSEAWNRLILNSAGEGIYGLDLEGKTTFVNSATATMLGYDSEMLIGVPMHATMHHTKSDGSPYPQEECPMYAAIRDGETHHVEDEILWRKDGTSFPAAYTSTPMRDEKQNIIGAVVTFADISERKASELALLKWNKALATSNQELDEFAYIASHDLKEPLRGIHNYSKILLEDHGEVLNNEAQVRCQTIIRLSRHMETLLDALLYFSRVGRSELGVGPTDLDSVLKDILESLEVGLKERGTLVYVPDILPTVTCDGIRVGEIFRNLITNAMKYNDKSEKWIEIGYIESQIDEAAVRLPRVFFVRDNGIGIREKHLETIFRIFKRLHGRDKFGGGTGAGLTMTKKMVERHGGRIWVESTYGEGSTFFFTLEPNHMAEEAEDQSKNMHEAVVN